MLDQTYMNMILCTCSFHKELCLNTWNSFRITFSLFGIGMIHFHFFLLPMSFSLPSSGSSRVPTSGSIFPRRGTCYPEKLASLPIPHGIVLLNFFYCHHPSPSFNHIFKIHLLNMSNHPYFDQLFPVDSKLDEYHVCKQSSSNFSKHLAWINNPIYHDLFKNKYVCKWS